MLAIFENTQTINNNNFMDNTLSKTPAELISIKSRFGEVSADLSKSIYFPKGLPGFSENLHFALLNFPQIRPGLENFKILQCLNDHSISLPVLPTAYENTFIDAADMKECLDTVEVKKENFAMMFILSSHKNPDGSFKLYINTKAPIVMDTSLKMAVQFVFTNNKYSVSQAL